MEKCGFEERLYPESCNKPKSENAKQLQCPPEKVEAIKDALKHLNML